MKQTRTRCKDVALHICENLDEDLNSRKCRQIRRHLAQCPNCTAYLDSLKKTVALYKRARNPRLADKYRLRLHSILESR